MKIKTMPIIVGTLETIPKTVELMWERVEIVHTQLYCWDMCGYYKRLWRFQEISFSFQ